MLRLKKNESELITSPPARPQCSNCAYHAACARITRTYDGVLADFRGDGILAYFGYPKADEDDAERTVRAGLDIAGYE